MKEKKDDRLSIAATVVFNTIRSYVKTKHAQSISAVQLDPASRQEARWTPLGFAFVHDLEQAAQHVFDTNPEEKPDLLKTWRSLIRCAIRNEELSVLTRSDLRFIEAMSKTIKARGLAPERYFRTNKYIHREPRKAVRQVREAMPVRRRAAA